MLRNVKCIAIIKNPNKWASLFINVSEVDHSVLRALTDGTYGKIQISVVSAACNFYVPYAVFLLFDWCHVP
jgi:hypothetical protein